MSLNLKSWNQIRHIVPAVIVGIVGVAASLALWELASTSENRAFAQDYAQRAENQASGLQNGIADYLDKLYAVRALFDSSSHGITRDEFERFANSLLVNQCGNPEPFMAAAR